MIIELYVNNLSADGCSCEQKVGGIKNKSREVAGKKAVPIIFLFYPD